MKMTAVLLLLVMVVYATMAKTIFQDKRGSKDVLSSLCCRYLKMKGYLTSNAKLKNLCLKTYHCNDVASKQSCLLFKTRNECSTNSKLSQVYCPFTCNMCDGVSVVANCKTSVPLGMQSKAIPDSQITASSFDDNEYVPSKARLHMHSNGWAPKRRRVGEWLQVDLGNKGVVTGIATQGSRKHGQWAKSYTLEYSNDGKVFQSYQSGKVFQGNTVKNTMVKNLISPPIYARYIRVYPQTWLDWPVMRMELYGCK